MVRNQVVGRRLWALGTLPSLLSIGFRAVYAEVVEASWADLRALRQAAWVSVWWRWVGWLVVIAEAAYRPELSGGVYLPFVGLHVVFVSANALVHHRLASGRSVSWGAVLALSAMDFVLIAVAVFADGGFDNFYYLCLYPSLALVAVVCPSFVVGLLWATVIAVLYGTLSLFLGSGVNLETNDEEVLALRLCAMYAVVAGVNLVAWLERARRRDSEERQQALLEQGLELSQVIHDTVGQTAYALGLGVERAKRMAGDGNEALSGTLAAASVLAKSIVWELRRPIDNGMVLGGIGLGETMRAHTETFGRVASLSAEVVQLGEEPPLPVDIRAGLFSVAHNALTNALLHSQAERVEVTLDFTAEWVRLSVSDDGIGLPDGYSGHGRGFHGMEADAVRMGGRSHVGTAGSEGGTKVTCEVPWKEGGWRFR